MDINFYVKSMESFIILSVMWYERYIKCYLLHTNPLKFRELGKTCQATCQAICFPLSTLDHWSFTEHTSWSSKSQLPKFPQWDLWAWILSQKWNDVLWVWTMGFDAFLCKYRLFWALKEIFSKSMIMLMWYGLLMKWSHMIWKICPQHLVCFEFLNLQFPYSYILTCSTLNIV